MRGLDFWDEWGLAVLAGLFSVLALYGLACLVWQVASWVL